MNVQLFCFLFTLYFISTVENYVIIKKSVREVNNAPIIGILSQEIDPSLDEKYPNHYDSYIAASYVKFVEGAGARAVPIWIGKDETYYEDILSKINGVIFPGGDAPFNVSNGYADAGEHIYKIAKRLNKNGDYFPLLGICLGFELMTYLAANRVEHRSKCSAEGLPSPLIFTSDHSQSELFKNAPKNVIEILQSENVTANFHELCVTKKDFNRVNLINELRIMSLNYDLNGLEYISTVEHTEYPFYALQFHPEKNDYEWQYNKKIPHGKNPSLVDHYFADFFIDEARKSTHNFADKQEELTNLIYNYPVTYTGLKKLSFLQCYLFKSI